MKRSIHQSTKPNLSGNSNTKKQKPLHNEIKTRQQSKEIIDNYHQLQVSIFISNSSN
jgi:hypothetical protein